MACRLNDQHVLGYLFEATGCREMVGLSIGGWPALCDDLISSSKLELRRYREYEAACKKLNIPKYPNLPTNWGLVIMAAMTDGENGQRFLADLKKFGQFGCFGGLTEEESKKIKNNYRVWKYE